MNVDFPVLDYREYQKPFVRYHRDGGRNAVLVWHRRAGKDLTCLQVMIEAAAETKGIYFYCLPEIAHARKAIWEGMTNDGVRFIDLIPKEIVKKLNNSEMKIELINGSLIRLVGSDQYNRLVGTNPRGIVFSEFSLTNPMAWEIMRPMLAANGGWAVFNGTPRGKNHFYDLLNQAKQNKDWFHSLITVDDTNVMSKEALEKEMREMDGDVFLQEYYCSFDAAIRGAYYSQQIAQLRRDHRVCKVPYEPNLLTYSAFDPGDNTTAIVYFQVYGKEIRFIYAEEHFSPSTEELYSSLTSKPYKYGGHFLPFDATVNQLAVGMSFSDQLKKMGLQNIKMLPQQTSKMEGIKIVQSAFPSFWIDESLEKSLIASISAYAPKYSEPKDTFSPQPDHNWASHMADAVRYAIIGMNLFVREFTNLPKPKPKKRSIYIGHEFV